MLLDRTFTAGIQFRGGVSALAQRAQHDRHAVDRDRHATVVVAWLVAGPGQFDRYLRRSRCMTVLIFELAEHHADALVSAAAERGERVAVPLVLERGSAKRSGSNFSGSVHSSGSRWFMTAMSSRRCRRDVVAQAGRCRAPFGEIAHRQRGHHPQRFVHDEVVGFQLLQRFDVQRSVAEPIGFVATAVLPFRVGREVSTPSSSSSTSTCRGRPSSRRSCGHDVVVGEPLPSSSSEWHSTLKIRSSLPRRFSVTRSAK